MLPTTTLSVHNAVPYDLLSNLPFLFDYFQVPSWPVEAVAKWVISNGFPASVANSFREVGVDGDLLLQLEDKNLKDDLQMTNGIQRKRFLRELNILKRNADYSCKDKEGIEEFLVGNVGPEYKVYTYNFLKNDLSLNLMRRLSPEELNDTLKEDAGIKSSIHRRKIIEAVCDDVASTTEDFSMSSSVSGGLLDSTSVSGEVYVSFDKSLSAELASLIRMQLQLRGFIVHTADTASRHSGSLDIVRDTKNFVIVLCRTALNGCIGDDAKKNPLHREVATALDSNCNIIPVFDDFEFPDSESLPEDMRALCFFNGVRWVHDYQDACLDKIERFITGETALSTSKNGSLGRLAINVGRRTRNDSGRSTPIFGAGAKRSTSRPRIRTVSSAESGIFFHQRD